MSELFNKVSNHIPTFPTPDGEWEDIERDHDHHQFNVSLEAQLGGVSSTAGCRHLPAERARNEAESRYYDSMVIKPQTINKVIPLERKQ